MAIVSLLLVLGSCSAPYDVRLSDDKSACNGPLFFFGWADPPLIPGTRLVDAPPGSRVVLWNHDLGFEAIVDLGDDCPVLVCEDAGARAPTDRELLAIRIVFPNWNLVPSNRIADYAMEGRLERRFWSHILEHLKRLEPAAAAEFALGESPAGWLATGGREWALCHVAYTAPLKAIPQIVNRTKGMSGADRTLVLVAVLGRRDLSPELLVKIVAAGAPIPAARHASADESVCFAAIAEVAKEPLSSERRSGLLDILDSPGVTPAVRERVLEVPLAYPEDREAVRAKASARNGER